MGVLDNLFTGQAATSNTNSNSVAQYPDWYKDLGRSVGANAASVAARPYQQYQGQRVADWAPEHYGALSRITGNAGAWDAPVVGGINALSELPGQVAPTYQAAAGSAGLANQAVGGPAQSWTDPGVAAKYMSPYTNQVVDNIARLGQRNMTENLLPAVNNSFIGAGGFGSTRNAAILGNTMRDVNQDILGQQSNALQAGYTTGANIFGADANRAQQQGQLQANTAIQGGNMALNAATGWGNLIGKTADQLGGLAQTGQAIQAADTNSLINAGNMQKSNQQAQLDAQYKDFQDYTNWDWNQLNNMTGVLGKMQVPTATTTSSQTGGTAAQPSGLQWLSSLAALFGNNGGTTTPAATT